MGGGGGGGGGGGSGGGGGNAARTAGSGEEVHDLSRVVPLLVYGCEMEALALAARLPRRLLPHVAFVDPSGRWCARWRRAHARLESDCVRSPVTQSPHPDPRALARFAGMADNGVVDRRNGAAASNSRLDELTASSKDFVELPGARLFAEFCAYMVSDAMLGVRGKTVQLRSRHACQRPCFVANTNTLLPSVYAPSRARDPSRRAPPRSFRQLERVLRDELRRMVPLGDAERERLGLTEGGVRVILASGASFVARAVVYAMRPEVFNWPAFVGRVEAAASANSNNYNNNAHDGGAVQRPPAHALLRGDEVDLRGLELGRGRVLVVGGGMQSAYLACGALSHGAGACTLVAHRRLRKREFEVEPRWMGNRELVGFRALPGAKERAARAAAARGGATINRHMWRRLQSHIREGELEVRQQSAVADVRWDGAQWRVSFADDACGAWDEVAGTEEAYDRIWLATGTHTDVTADPALREFLRLCPCELAKGMPMLEADLSWPDAPVFFIGPLTLLQTGPAAGLMPGIRHAADVVLKGLQQPLPIVDPLQAEELPSAPEMRARVPPPPVAFRADFLGTAARAPTRREAHQSDRAGVDRGSGESELLVSLLSADPSGCNAWRSLPRREVQHYVLAQCEHDWELGPPRPEHFWIDVTVSLDEPVAQEDIRCHFGERSLEMWARSENALWHLNIPRLYKAVASARNCFKAVPAKRKIVISLHKLDDSEWAFLKA